MPAMLRIPIPALQVATKRALKQAGYTPEDVDAITEVLTYGHLRGNYQQLVLWAAHGISPAPEAQPTVKTRRTPASLLLDGGRQHGIVVMRKATDLARGLALEGGFGMVGTRNTETGTAAIGWYARELALSGLIGVALSGSAKRVAHYGSFERMYGTNPLAVGFPARESDPVVIDFASSAVPLFRVVEAALLGRRLPNDAAYGPDGTATTDPLRAQQGALQSFDRGPKGSAIALFIEVMTGALVGITNSDARADQEWGNLILAIDPGILGGREEYERGFSELTARIKSGSPLRQGEQVVLPGERSNQLAAKCAKRGYIEIENVIWQRFCNELASTNRPRSRTS